MPPVNPWTKTLFPSLHDVVIMAVYLTLIFILAYHTQNKKIGDNPLYKYYTKGLFAKIAGVVAFVIIYTAYYEGGDTTGFYRSSEAMVNVLFENPQGYFRLLLGDRSPEALSAFNPRTGYSGYTYSASAFTVVRFASLTTLFGFKNYYTSSILFASFFYFGFWKLFLLFAGQYPKYHKSLAFAILYFPSVIFWGSGILKDTITLSMTCWFVYSFYQVFVHKQKIFKNSLGLLISGYLVILVKAYVFVALIPGVLLYFGWNKLKTIENKMARFLAAPIIVAIFLMIAFGFLQLFKSQLGVYGSIDTIIEKAIITYEDHTRSEAYGTNFYKIGEFDGTLGNFVAKAPLAIVTALFRPFIWEARNPVMFIAGLENLALVIIVLVILWRTGPVKATKIAFEEPLVVFSLTFAILFAFSVGISSGNFGALVRFKIPLLPFFVAGLFILLNKSLDFKKGTD